MAKSDVKALWGRAGGALGSLTDTAEDGRMIRSIRSFSLLNCSVESCAKAEAGRRSLADGARFTTAELGRLFSDN